MIKRTHYSLALVALGAFTAALDLGTPGISQAQGNPPPPPARDSARPLPPGPLGERPPGPDLERPVDPKTAPVAVKSANDALAGLTAGRVWTRTAPRGEQEVQATLVFNGKDVAHLDFDPTTSLLRTRGEGRPVPPAPDALRPVPPAPDANASAPGAPAPVPPPPAPEVNAPAPVNLDSIKVNFAGIFKSLSIGQGAEIMPREGFWRVPIIFQNRVVGELHVSGDGTQIMEDFMAARGAAIFAR